MSEEDIRWCQGCGDEIAAGEKFEVDKSADSWCYACLQKALAEEGIDFIFTGFSSPVPLDVPDSLAQEVWQTLSRIDVSEYTEKKGRFTYLSWFWAWATLQELYPESTYRPLDVERFEAFEDGLVIGHTVSVGMEVTIRKGDAEITRQMWLQVLDNTNNAIINPDSHEVNKTRMRCLAKTVAMCGLGSYLYAGQDLPIPEDSRPSAKPRIPDHKLFAQFLEKMDTAENLGQLKTHYEAAKKHFIKDKERMKILIDKKDTLKKTFEAAK